MPKPKRVVVVGTGDFARIARYYLEHDSNHPVTFVGVNATIRDGIRIGWNCVIGGGALVLSDVADGSVLRGNSTEPLPIESRKLTKI